MIFILISITLLAAMSPWPDFIIVMKNAITSKKNGYFTALWVALAILIHISYCIAWVGIIISQSIVLFQIIKIIGALYLLYLSYQLLVSPKNKNPQVSKGKEIDWFTAFKQGFTTNILNPKATLFFLSVFTQVISPETSSILQLIYWVTMAMTAGLWFSLLTTIVNISYVKNHISYVQFYLDKLMWWILALLGLKMLFSGK